MAKAGDYPGNFVGPGPTGAPDADQGRGIRGAFIAVDGQHPIKVNIPWNQWVDNATKTVYYDGTTQNVKPNPDLVSYGYKFVRVGTNTNMATATPTPATNAGIASAVDVLLRKYDDLSTSITGVNQAAVSAAQAANKAADNSAKPVAAPGLPQSTWLIVGVLAAVYFLFLKK